MVFNDIFFTLQVQNYWITMASEAPESMQRLFKYIDDHRQKWIDNLAEAVAIKSVSAW